MNFVICKPAVLITDVLSMEHPVLAKQVIAYSATFFVHFKTMKAVVKGENLSVLKKNTSQASRILTPYSVLT